jgi:fatty acid desaturase
MQAWIDSAQRDEVTTERKSAAWRGEWPTWLLIVVMHGGWLATLVYWPLLGAVPATLLMIWWCAWYMSLQHELIHGHPTRWPWLNRLFGYAPLAVWYPYQIYRASHLRHHNDFDLTLPELDAESTYVSPAGWAAMSRPLRALLWWIDAAFGVSAVWYVLAISYPAQSLTMIRSYYEHRPAEDHKQRIVLNDAGLVFRILFLNNNLHLVHHDLPSLPWYLLPRVYAGRREAYSARSGGFQVNGYGELMRRYGFRPIDAPVHPRMP